jgi:hypothetical protein
MLLILRNRIVGCGAGRQVQVQSLPLCTFWSKSQWLLRNEPYRAIGRPAPIPSPGTDADSGSSRVRAASIVTITCHDHRASKQLSILGPEPELRPQNAATAFDQRRRARPAHPCSAPVALSTTIAP